MRANKVISYRSILEVLYEPGCPFCRFMKDVQASALQNPGSAKIDRLCNFHTWGLAAMQRASAAAELFLSLLQKEARASPCSVCVLLREEEDRRIQEFIHCLNRRQVIDWLQTRAVLCSVHGEKLQRSAPPLLAATILKVLERYRKRLVENLEKLRDDPQPESPNWGLLGHAAEFLVSQRGLHI
jgi:hypothetical protein